MREQITRNQQFRTRSEKLASRTVSAIVRNAPDEFSDIIRDASIDGTSEEGGVVPLETGDAHGVVRDQEPAGPQPNEPVESGSGESSSPPEGLG